jgi:hypothetical protein
MDGFTETFRGIKLGSIKAIMSKDSQLGDALDISGWQCCKCKSQHQACRILSYVVLPSGCVKDAVVSSYPIFFRISKGRSTNNLNTFDLKELISREKAFHIFHCFQWLLSCIDGCEE